MSLKKQIRQLSRQARGACRVLANLSTTTKNAALVDMAKVYGRLKQEILKKVKA